MNHRRKYRVLVVPAWYPCAVHPFAGAFVREQVRALVRRGHEVSVLVIENESPSGGVLGTATAVEEDGALVVRCRARSARPRQIATLVRAVALQAGLQRVRARGRQPEVVHSHVFSAGLLAIPLAHTLDAPLVVSEHYSGFARGSLTRWDRVIARRVFAAADLVVPVCEDLRSHIEAVCAHGRFEVVPNLVDTELFTPDQSVSGPHPATPARLLLVGGLTEVKGIPNALGALARLPAPATLDVVGDGPRRSEYETRSRTLRVADRVRWHGVLPPARIAALMRTADLYVLASEWENLPTVVLESLACGLPVVATRVGGVPEIVGDGDGILVAPHDSDALARGIAQGLRTKWDRKAISRRAALRYGAHRVVTLWEAIYEGLLPARCC